MNSIPRDDSRFSDEEIVNLARNIEPHDFDRIDPPPQVWNNVLAELEVARASEEASARRQSQRWFTSTRVLSAAAVAVLVVGVAVAVLTTRSGDPVEQQLATAVMTDEGLPVSTLETATAEVVCADEDCFVDVTLTGLPNAGDAALELWVINSDVTDMHSLGEITSSGRYPLPDEVSHSDFPVVDISIEPRDGEPTHSGQSVLRGVLDDV